MSLNRKICTVITLFVLTSLCTADDIDPLESFLSKYIESRIAGERYVVWAESVADKIGYRQIAYGQTTMGIERANFYIHVLCRIEYEVDMMSFLSTEISQRDLADDAGTPENLGELAVLHYFASFLAGSNSQLTKSSPDRFIEFADLRIPSLDAVVKLYMHNRIECLILVKQMHTFVSLIPHAREKAIAIQYADVLLGFEEHGLIAELHGIHRELQEKSTKPCVPMPQCQDLQLRRRKILRVVVAKAKESTEKLGDEWRHKLEQLRGVVSTPFAPASVRVQNAAGLHARNQESSLLTQRHSDDRHALFTFGYALMGGLGSATFALLAQSLWKALH